MLDIRPLRSSTFRHLAVAYTINELGNWIGDVALAILVFDRTGSALATASLFIALRFLPAVLAPVLTTHIESVPARRVLPTLYFAEAAIFAAIALLSRHTVLSHDAFLPVVLALTALDGMLAIAAKALTRSATVAGLHPQGLLRQGNAILNLGFTSGGAVGPALAGVVVASGGPGAALWLDAGTFAAAGAALATAPRLKVVSDHASSAVERLRAGLDAVRFEPAVRRLMIALAFILLFNAIVVPIEVVFVKRTLHDGDQGYGLLLGAWGIGMIVGGTAFAAAGRLRTTVVLAVGGLAMAAGYGGLAASPDLGVACVFSALGGFGNGIGAVTATTALQEGVPIKSQSAVMALFGSLDQAVPAVGFILGGLVTALSSPRAAYALAAAGIALVLAVGTVSARRPAMAA